MLKARGNLRVEADPESRLNFQVLAKAALTS
jgi:hypothetical protein